jgi:hypothetical protein
MTHGTKQRKAAEKSDEKTKKKVSFLCKKRLFARRKASTMTTTAAEENMSPKPKQTKSKRTKGVRRQYRGLTDEVLKTRLSLIGKRVKNFQEKFERARMTHEKLCQEQEHRVGEPAK